MANTSISRRNFLRQAPLAGVAASIPSLARESVEQEAAEPAFDWIRFQDNMDRLRTKAAKLAVGDLVQLDNEPYDDKSAPMGNHYVSEVSDTFLKVRGFDGWMPIERVEGKITIY